MIDTAELVVSELATNAVRRSWSGSQDGWFVVSVDLGEADRVQVSVTDLGGDQAPAQVVVPDDAECGRGLHLVQMVAKEWGVDSTALGRRVWADLATDEET